MNETRSRFRTFMFPGRKLLPNKPRYQQALVSAGVWLLLSLTGTQMLFGWPI